MEWKKLLSLERQVEKDPEPEEFKKYPISEVEKDYQAIISSSAFRRLQDKTQVFPLDKSDFVRTRLTHSIEVSTIARHLGVMVTQNKTKYKKPDFTNNEEVTKAIPVVLSCAGLLHDIGNPPFGHFGEVVIGDWFKKELKNDNFTFKDKKVSELFNAQMKNDLENFEGNAQALRILSKIKNNAEGYDMNLTYGVLNTLIKYPNDSCNFDKDDADVKKHKLGYYFSENEIMKKICQETGALISNKCVRHPLAYLMEAADDIAYSTADLEDAMKKGLFTLDEFINYYKNEVNKIEDRNYKKYSLMLLDDLEGRISHDYRTTEIDLIAFQKWMELVRKWLMYVVAYSFSINYNDIMKGIYTNNLFFNTNHQETVEILKNAMKKFVFNNKEILKLELSAKKIIWSLLDDFIYAVIYFEEEEQEKENKKEYNEEENKKSKSFKPSKTDKKLIEIISENYKDDYRHAKTDDEAINLYLRFLMVTDFISGMTDSYAKNLYKELNGLQ